MLVHGNGLHPVTLDGKTSRRLVADTTNIMGGSCRFSPDGRALLFVGFSEEDKSMPLYLADVKSGTVRALVEAKNFGDTQACWSPDSRRVDHAVTPWTKRATAAAKLRSR